MRPERPKIYHITHVDNLRAIVESKGLISDRESLRRGGPIQTIGMSDIKKRRLEEIEVTCRPGTKVGDYVPFYFCPRSIMLYVIHCGNHPELTYRGGQGPIVHLEADLNNVIDWAEANGKLWAFSLSNAGAYYTRFRCGRDQLAGLDWTAIAANDFRASQVKEGKQAEFLLFESFPFSLIERIGVQSSPVLSRATVAVTGSPHQPAIEVRRGWYF